MIKRILLWLLPFTVLFGCDAPPADGYTFEKEQFVNQDLRVRVEFVTAKEIQDKWPQFKDIGAWGRVNPNGSCTIYIVDPRQDYEPELLGHELTHCIFGEWHPKQNKLRVSR